MVINLMSLGRDTTPELKSAQKKIEKALVPFSGKQISFTAFDNEKSFLEQLSKSVSKDDIIVLATDKDLYIPFKNFIIKVFQLKNRTNKTVSKIIKTKLPVDENYINDDVFAAHAVFPIGCNLMLSEDGLYSGFAVEANNQIVIVMPFDDDRIDFILNKGLLPYLSEKTGIEVVKPQMPYDEEIIKSTVKLLTEKELRFAIAKTNTVDFIENISINTAQLSPVIKYTDFSIEKNKMTPREYAIKLAEGALNASNCDLGVSITKVFIVKKEDKTNEMFVYVCIADKDKANAVKIFANEGETPPQLIYSAVEELFKMVADWANTAQVTSKIEEPVNKELKTEKKPISKTKATFIILIFIALILTVATAWYLGAFGDGVSAKINLFNKTNAVKSVDVTLKNSDAKAEDDYEFSNNGGVDISDYLKLYQGQKTETTAALTTSATKAATASSSTSSKSGTSTLKSTAAATAAAAESKSSNGSYPDTLMLGGNKVETKYAIARIVQGEMGSSYQPQALKAQAVAAFTYIKKNNWSTSGLSCSTTYSNKVLDAVEDVLGTYATYNGKTALTIFFAMSAGKTVNSASIWKSAAGYPYLQGGIASNDQSEQTSSSKYQTTKTYTSGELKTLIEKATGVTLNSEPSTWIKINNHDNAVSNSIGYISSMTVGSKEMTGHYFRETVLNYGIRSQCFTVNYDSSSDTFTFTVYGYGHGVGMSQCGANYLAKQGYTYEQILKYYYPGIALANS